MFEVALSAILLIAILVISGRYIKSNSTKVIGYSSAGIIGRITSSIHGFQPLTSSIIYSGMHNGPIAGLMTGIVGTLVSSLFLGIGLWVLPQMILWGALGFIVGVMKDKFKTLTLLKLTYVSFIYQIVFGIVMDISMFYLFQWLIGSYMYTSVIAAIMGGMLFNLRAGLFSAMYTAGIGCSVKVLNQVLDKKEVKNLVSVN